MTDTTPAQPSWMSRYDSHAELRWRGKHDASWLLLTVRSPPDVRVPFCAGVLYDESRDRVMRTAPILKYLLGLDAETLRAVARANGWTLTRAKPDERDQALQPLR